MSNRTYYSHEAEMQAARERMAMTSVCIILGLGIGAILALLFTPTSGEKIRHEIGHAVGEGLHNGQRAVEPVIEQLEREMKDLRKKVDERRG